MQCKFSKNNKQKIDLLHQRVGGRSGPGGIWPSAIFAPVGLVDRSRSTQTGPWPLVLHLPPQSEDSLGHYWTALKVECIDKIHLNAIVEFKPLKIYVPWTPTLGGGAVHISHSSLCKCSLGSCNFGIKNSISIIFLIAPGWGNLNFKGIN